MIIVTDPLHLEHFKTELSKEPKFSLDSETTGLRWYQGDIAFLWAIALAQEEFVIDLRRVNPEAFYQILWDKLQDPGSRAILANAKFDLHMANTGFKHLLKEDLCKKLLATIDDVQVKARLVKNDRMTVSLDSIAKDYGFTKDDAVMEWIKKNNAYKWQKTPMGEWDKIPRFDMVPLEIIYPYAAKDARVTYDSDALLDKDLEALDSYNKTLSVQKSLFTVLEQEREVTKTLFRMEEEGVLLDEKYTERSFNLERSRFAHSAEEITKLAGRPFIDSGKVIGAIFSSIPEIAGTLPRTEKGNFTFKDEVLSAIDHPIAKHIANYREAYKKAGTYYSNFIYLQGRDGRIRTGFRQASTGTGRLSAGEPNLQNINAEEEGLEYYVRGCFIAPSDYYWVSIDYQAQEFRMLLDFAEQLDVIEQVIAGSDVHQATADLLGISRRQAKTINFGLLYGMGVALLAASLGVTIDEAKILKSKYFRGLPKIQQFIYAITNKAERGFVSNWFGRIYKFDKKFAYKAVNYIIQGGCSEVTKKAMVDCDKYIIKKKLKSRLTLSVHDELCFYVHKNELHHIKEFARIMEGAYPFTHLPLTTSVEIGTRWSALEDFDEWQEKQKQSLVIESDKTLWVSSEEDLSGLKKSNKSESEEPLIGSSVSTDTSLPLKQNEMTL